MIKYVEKSWGSESWIVNREYCGKLMAIDPHKFCSAHKHREKTETFFSVQGQLRVEYCKECQTKKEFIDNCKVIILDVGDSFDIEPGTYHRFSSNTNEPCVFIEFSTHHEDSDTYRL